MSSPTDTTKNRLKKILSIRNIKPIELSNLTGIPKSSISQYLSGYAEPRQNRLFLLAQALNVSETWLLGYDVPMEKQPYYDIYSRFPEPNIADDCVPVPVIGEVAAGYDHWAVENWGGDTVNIPAEYLKGHSKSDFYVLTVHGDSMYPMFIEGDKVLVLKQSTLDKSGDIGVIIYDNDVATLKKIEFVKGENWLTMIPLNPNYPPKKITGTDLELCRIIGVPKLVIREWK